MTSSRDRFDQTEPCANCGGEATLDDVAAVNLWVNDGSAYLRASYTCDDCGRSGGVSERGDDRTGCLAPPTEDPSDLF